MKLTTEIERLKKSVKRLKAELNEAKKDIAETGMEIMAYQTVFKAWESQLPELYIKAVEREFDKFNRRREETDAKRRRK